MPDNYLTQVRKKTNVEAITMAFALADGAQCSPKFGDKKAIDDPKLLEDVKNFQKLGGKVIVATGGAMGPYLEATCTDSNELAKAYKKVLDAVGTTHLDIDIEATINEAVMIDALKKLSSMVKDLTISFTLMVQSDDFGLTNVLGVDILKKMAANGIEVDIVNAMAMEFSTRQTSWGDAVVLTGQSVHRQLKEIWPNKSDEELYAKIGITPMIGRNFNGKIFEVKHAYQLLKWAQQTKIGHLSFWSLGRDNGHCSGGGISPNCSSISQEEFQFCNVLKEYSKTIIPDHFKTTTTTTTTTENPKTKSTTTTSKTTTTMKPSPIDCEKGKFFPHEKFCNYYYWCFDGKPHIEKCPDGTVWDPRINACNYKNVANRHDCI